MQAVVCTSSRLISARDWARADWDTKFIFWRRSFHPLPPAPTVALADLAGSVYHLCPIQAIGRELASRPGLVKSHGVV